MNEMHLMSDMSDYLVRTGRSKQELADAMFLDLSTVRKQLSGQDSTITLQVAYRYAEALGGTVKFLTEDQAAELEKGSSTAAELARTVSDLTVDNERLRKQLADLTETLSRVQRQNDTFAAALSEKDHELYAASATVRKLVEKYAL